jgi:hypothetical protein
MSIHIGELRSSMEVDGSSPPADTSESGADAQGLTLELLRELQARLRLEALRIHAEGYSD